MIAKVETASHNPTITVIYPNHAPIVSPHAEAACVTVFGQDLPLSHIFIESIQLFSH